MTVEVIIDYAYPCMMAETALRKVHDHMLHGNFDAALEEALIAAVEVKLMTNAIKDMKGKPNADTQDV
jgi:hypothetical protein